MGEVAISGDCKDWAGLGVDHAKVLALSEFAQGADCRVVQAHGAATEILNPSGRRCTAPTPATLLETLRQNSAAATGAQLADRILSEDLSPRSRGLIEQMGNLASDMWRQAADAWNERDRSAAFALGARDIEMDDLHASLIAELASGRMALPVTMGMPLVARLYKRLGAHAANITRRVVYLAGSAAS